MYHYALTQTFIKINIFKLDKFSYKILFKYFCKLLCIHLFKMRSNKYNHKKKRKKKKL